MIWPESIRVAGVTFHLKDVTQLISEDVVLIREPNDAHAKAIAIYAVWGENWKQKIGFVPRVLADMVPDSKLPAVGKVVWKSEPPTVAVRVRA